MNSSFYWFILLWIFRYLRLIVNCLSHWTFRPIALPKEPTLTCDDVTIIIPTIPTGKEGDEQLCRTIQSCLANSPREIILVTTDANFKALSDIASSISVTKIRVLSVAHANKRRQMCRAIPEVRNQITVFVDDDVIWPPKILQWILAAFERPKVGGVGTCQRLKREEKPNLWNFLGALYLERRNFEISATTHLDGGISCLSGRTVGYRSKILQDPAFTYGFTHEYWLASRFQLNCDDDNFITRWMVSHGWQTHVQYCKAAELQTTLENNSKFLKQCLRWSRSNWRSNLKSMVAERHIWRRQPWSSYALHVVTLSPPAIVGDGALVYLCYNSVATLNINTQFWVLFTLGLWMFLSKFIKLFGHFFRYPEDILMLPASIAFGYFHGLIKYYAFFTLNVTTWGSREGADDDDAYRMIPVRTRVSEKT
ncbi:MAG: hypothetical protein M1814_001839 [Vezdaea aestivalis]|nr:MAG: hypothetical protein M1814_001839 [Vezdaea aestivalis]